MPTHHRGLIAACALVAALPVAAAAQSTSAQMRMNGPAAETRAVAERGFERFKDGLATGHWQPFLEMLSDDFEFYFPQGKYRGRNTGKAKAEEFFGYVSATFAGGLKVTDVYRMTAGDTTVVFEFTDEGSLRGEPYRNRVAISWDIRDGKIASYREYFGSDGK